MRQRDPSKEEPRIYHVFQGKDCWPLCFFSGPTWFGPLHIMSRKPAPGQGGSNPAVVPHDLVGEPGAQESKLLLPFWAGAISKFIPFLP